MCRRDILYHDGSSLDVDLDLKSANFKRDLQVDGNRGAHCHVLVYVFEAGGEHMQVIRVGRDVGKAKISSIVCGHLTSKAGYGILNLHTGSSNHGICRVSDGTLNRPRAAQGLS